VINDQVFLDAAPDAAGATLVYSIRSLGDPISNHCTRSFDLEPR
jgi:hypothetical protein